MKILAFLQNQWFHNPERMKKLLATFYKNDRELFTRTFLFWDGMNGMCLTGRRLLDAFGEDLCQQIIWEEASPEICGSSSACPPADPAHMADVISRHNPEIILCFGNIAAAGLEQIPNHTALLILIRGPHPAARGDQTIVRIVAMASRLHDSITLLKAGRPISEVI